MCWTKLLISASKSAPPHSFAYSVNVKFTLPAAQTLDSSLSLTSSIRSLVKSYWHNLQNVSRIHLFVTTSTATTVVQVFIVCQSECHRNFSFISLPLPWAPSSVFSQQSTQLYLSKTTVRSPNSPTRILKLLPFSLTGEAKARLASLTSSPSLPLPHSPLGSLNILDKPHLRASAPYSAWNACVPCVGQVASVVSDSLPPHGLQPARLLCPWESPGKNTGVGCHVLFQGIFPTQGSNPLSNVSWSGRRVLYH